MPCAQGLFIVLPSCFNLKSDGCRSVLLVLFVVVAQRWHIWFRGDLLCGTVTTLCGAGMFTYVPAMLANLIVFQRVAPVAPL